jgi:Trp operon repressor
MDAKKSEKISRIANGMIDSQLKGLGIAGAAVVALKSALMELGKQHASDRPKYEEAVFDLLGFSPPLGSKIQKINSGFRSFSWNMKDIKNIGFSLDNPSYLAGAQIVTGLTNIPLDRVIKKLNSMRGIVSEQSSLWQKVALGLGWSTWDVGLGYYGGFDAAKVLTPEEQAIEDVNTMKKETKTQEQIDMLLNLGLTKKEIKALGKEQARVEKIIELQKTETKPEVKPEVKVEDVKEEPKPEVKQETKPRKETAERRLRRQFDSIKGENKPEQVKTLLDYGLSKKQIRELRYEKNRVEKILELMYKNKKK